MTESYPLPMLSVPAGNIDEEQIAAAIQFATERVAPNAQTWEDQGQQPERELRDAIRTFTPLVVSTEMGGRGGSFATVARIYEELARRDLGFTCALAVHNNVTVATTTSENVGLRDAVLPKLMSGDAIGAFLLTEPDAGSDATSIITRADQTADGFRVSGRKAWVTSGIHADVFVTFCQTQQGSGAKGVVALGIERSAKGLKVSPMLDLFGSHAMGTTDVSFDDVEVPQANIAFPTGKAFRAAMFGIDVARVGVAAMCNGALQGGLHIAAAYAAQRKTFGKALADHQGLAWKLADVATKLEASRSLTFQAVDMLDRRQDATLLAAHAKKFATVAAFEGLSTCMQILGANGLKNEYGLARQLAAARVTEFMDGTGEIQNIVIARSLRLQAEGGRA